MVENDDFPSFFTDAEISSRLFSRDGKLLSGAICVVSLLDSWYSDESDDMKILCGGTRWRGVRVVGAVGRASR